MTSLSFVATLSSVDFIKSTADERILNYDSVLEPLPVSFQYQDYFDIFFRLLTRRV